MIRGQREKLPLREAERLAERILKEVRKFPEVDKVLVAGSIRRRIKEIKDIDITIETRQHKEVIERFCKLKFIKTIVEKSKLKARVITKKGVQVDVRAFDHNSFGAGLLHTTGSKEHNRWLEKTAEELGYKLNEHGLYNKSGEQIGGKTEKGIYALLGFKLVRPENRFGEEEVRSP